MESWRLFRFRQRHADGRLYGGNSSQLRVYDRSGRQLQLVGPPGDYGAPSLSPDETKVAFTRRDDQAAGDIWTMDLARQTLSRFTFDAGSDIYLVWSSDGRTIVYESTRDGLFARNADGTGTATHLYATPSSLIPVQVMSDRKLPCSSPISATHRLRHLHLAARRRHAKARTRDSKPGHRLEPALSPDGRWLAYASVENAGVRRVRPAVSRYGREVADFERRRPATGLAPRRPRAVP